MSALLKIWEKAIKIIRYLTDTLAFTPTHWHNSLNLNLLAQGS